MQQGQRVAKNSTYVGYWTKATSRNSITVWKRDNHKRTKYVRVSCQALFEVPPISVCLISQMNVLTTVCLFSLWYLWRCLSRNHSWISIFTKTFNWPKERAFKNSAFSIDISITAMSLTCHSNMASIQLSKYRNIRGNFFINVDIAILGHLIGCLEQRRFSC